MLANWQIASQRIAISTGQIVSCRDLMQSMKFRLYSSETGSCSSCHGTVLRAELED
jgi:hypothetical protein